MGAAPPNRRQFLRAALAGAVGGPLLGLGGYSWQIEPNEVTVEQLEIPIAGLPDAFDGFRIVQLSDLHYGPYTGEREISAAVRQANDLQPDLTLLTGDFVTSPTLDKGTATRRILEHASKCARLLAGLHATRGVLACLGNHDVSVDADAIAETLNSAGIPVLSNSSRRVERDGARLWVAGVDDALYGHPDMEKALAGIPAKGTVILLAHEPDYADVAARSPIALQLSGHSHGGQIRLPFIGAPYLPPLARKYPFGHYRVGNMDLYTNRGIGTIVLPLRFNAPPEVTLITVRAG